MNHYATKKTLAESMLDVALFMANATQLKAVLEQGPGFTYYITLITLISLSLALQVVIGILLIIIDCVNAVFQTFNLQIFRDPRALDQIQTPARVPCVPRRNLNNVSKQPKLDLMNNVATALVFVTVLINIFITAFGVQKTGLYPSRGPREVQ